MTLLPSQSVTDYTYQDQQYTTFGHFMKMRSLSFSNLLEVQLVFNHLFHFLTGSLVDTALIKRLGNFCFTKP